MLWPHHCSLTRRQSGACQRPALPTNRNTFHPKLSFKSVSFLVLSFTSFSVSDRRIVALVINEYSCMAFVLKAPRWSLSCSLHTALISILQVRQDRNFWIQFHKMEEVEVAHGTI